MARVVVDVMLKPEILDPQGQAVANALNESGSGDGARPVWVPPSANGLFGGLPPRIRELAQALFVVDPPSPNGELWSAEETPAD